MAPRFLECGCKVFDDGGTIMCSDHIYEYNSIVTEGKMGKVIEFRTKPDIELGEIIEVEQAVKHISKLFTKEELAEIRRELEEMETNKHHGG